MKKIIILLILTFGLANFSGCDVINPISPIIAGYTMWKDGEAIRYYKWNKSITYKSLYQALEVLEYKIEKDETKKYGNYVVAGANDRFAIKVIEVEDDITCVKIRINFLGDKPYAELLYKEIDNQINIIQYNKRLSR